MEQSQNVNVPQIHTVDINNLAKIAKKQTNRETDKVTVVS